MGSINNIFELEILLGKVGLCSCLQKLGTTIACLLVAEAKLLNFVSLNQNFSSSKLPD